MTRLLQDDVAVTKEDLQIVLNDAHSASNNHDGTTCADASTVAADVQTVAADADTLSADLQTLQTDIASLRNDEQTLGSALIAVENDEPGFSGGASVPGPTDVETTIAKARRSINAAIGTANGQVDDLNSAVVTAYGYSKEAGQANSCGSAESLPRPLKHTG